MSKYILVLIGMAMLLPVCADEFTSGSIDMDQSGRRFELLQGKGVELCEVYKKNLEALGNPNLACERQVSSEYAGILKLPEWRKLDLWENRNLWSQVEETIHVGLLTPGWEQPRVRTASDQYQIDQLAKSYQEHTEQYQEEVYKLYVANIDVNNKGKSELVLRNGSGLCGEQRTYKSIALFVLNAAGDAVDLQKSRPLFQDSGSNRWAKELQQNGTIGNGSMYDLFFYKDNQ
jgi:hypothetical protein